MPFTFNNPATAAQYTYNGNTGIYIHYLNGVHGFRKKPEDLSPDDVAVLIAKGDKRFAATSTAAEVCDATTDETGPLAD